MPSDESLWVLSFLLFFFFNVIKVSVHKNDENSNILTFLVQNVKLVHVELEGIRFNVSVIGTICLKHAENCCFEFMGFFC